MAMTVDHPAFGSTPVRVEETYIPDDPDGQVAATIGMMGRYAVEDSQDPAVVRDMQAALGTADIQSLLDLEKVRRIFAYVKGRIGFVEDDRLTSGFGKHDPGAPIVEALIRPADMAVMCEGGGCQRVGDCDDFSMYTAALLLAAGVKAKFVTVAADPVAPQHFSHVYVAAYTGDGARVPMDTSHGPEVGWETKAVTRIQEWPIGGIGVLELAIGGVVVLTALRAMGVW